MPLETEKHSLMMIGGKKLVDDNVLVVERRSLGIFLGSQDFAPTTFSLRGVWTSRTRMAQGLCSAHVIFLHLTFSILMFHPPSLLVPDGHFETTFPPLTSAPSLPNFTRSESADQAHFRTSGGEFGYLADPTHSTRTWMEAGVPLVCS